MTAIEVNDRLEELVTTCSHTGGNQRTCPLFHIRQLTEKSRFRYLKTLTENEKRQLLLSHLYCSEGLLGNEIKVN